MASDSEPREKFLRPPRPLQKSHFEGSKCFYTVISVHNTLANCNKASIKKSSAHRRNCVLNRPIPDFYTAIWPFR